MFFFFNDTATTEIYTLSLHDALPILTVSIPGRDTTLPLSLKQPLVIDARDDHGLTRLEVVSWRVRQTRSEEHTSELQSQSNLVCRLLLEKKKTKKNENVRARVMGIRC